MTSPETTLALTYDMHGNEGLGAVVAELVEDNPRIATVSLHPQAAAKGVRCLGEGMELGSRIPFDGDPADPDDGEPDDPDNLAAAQATKKLRSFPINLPVVDAHCTTLPNNNFAFLGNLVPAQSLAMARILERPIIQWFSEYPFFEDLPGVLGVETTTRSEAEMTEQALRLARNLNYAAELGRAGLRTYFYDTGLDGFQFYKRTVDIMLVRPDGTPNQPVLDVLDELEAIEAGIYSRVVISPRVAEAIQIPPGVHTVNTWGYANMSAVLPDGVRHRCFGDLLDEIAPPTRIRESDFFYFVYRP